MYKVISASLWKEISKIAKSAHHRRAAIAYVSDPKVLSLRTGDVLVVDASERAIKARNTTHHALNSYFKAGARLFSLPGLHAKIAVLGDYAVVGSANASSNSANKLIEAAFVTDSSAVVGQATALIEQYMAMASELDSDALEKIKQIPVDVATTYPSSSKRPTRDPRAPRYWFMGVWDAEYPGDESTQERLRKELKRQLGRQRDPYPIFVPTKNRFAQAAQVGDYIVTASRANKADFTPHEIALPSRIEKIWVDERHTNFFVVGRRDAEKRLLTWGRFLRAAKQAGIKREPRAGSTFELTEKQVAALEAIWPV